MDYNPRIQPSPETYTNTGEFYFKDQKTTNHTKRIIFFFQYRVFFCMVKKQV